MIIIEAYMLFCGIVVLIIAPIHAIIMSNRKQKQVREHITKYMKD